MSIISYSHKPYKRLTSNSQTEQVFTGFTFSLAYFSNKKTKTKKWGAVNFVIN